MDYPNLSFHVHQILSALRDISNHLPYLPDASRAEISSSLNNLLDRFSEMVADFDETSGEPSLKDEYAASDKTTDVSPFDRTGAVEFFDNFIALNADGVFTYANPAAFTIFGRHDRDLKGKNIWEALPELKNGPLYPTFQEAVETRLPAHVEMTGIDNRFFAINVHPTRHGVIIYWQDITEKKNIEEALRASEERLRAAIETAPINVFTLDKNLRYVWIGTRRDGFFHEPVLGKRDDELLPAQDAAVLMEAEQTVLDTGRGQRKEVRFQKKGRPVIYTMAIEPLFDAAKGVVGLTIAVMDVTEQRRLEAERRNYATQMELQRRLIENSENERAELARNLHDGPIQRLVGLGFSVQIIKDVLKSDRQGGDEDLKQLSVDIKDAVTELREVCNELRPPVLSRLGLRRAMQEHMDTFERNHPTIRVVTDFSDQLPKLPDAISNAIYRIYQHAMNNIAHHAQATEVSVQLQITPQQVLLEIHDNGKGMAESIDWLKFARDGHLGLVGMKERAEAVGGTFQLISEPGDGTVVQVVVPLNQQ